MCPIDIWKFDGTLGKVMVGITNEEIIQDCSFPLKIMIPLMGQFFVSSTGKEKDQCQNRSIR